MAHDIAPLQQAQPDTLDEKVRQALAAGALFESLRLREALGEDGDYFHRDPKTGDKIISYKGLLVEERKDTVTVVIAKPGADTDGVVRELGGYSQKAIGAVIGETQQGVSDRVLAMARRK
jgi:hypothetical protein